MFGVSPDDSVTGRSLGDASLDGGGGSGKSSESGTAGGASVIGPRWAIIVGVRTVGGSSSRVFSRISSDSESKSGGFGGSIIVPVKTSSIFLRMEGNSQETIPRHKRRGGLTHVPE